MVFVHIEWAFSQLLYDWSFPGRRSTEPGTFREIFEKGYKQRFRFNYNSPSWGFMPRNFGLSWQPMYFIPKEKINHAKNRRTRRDGLNRPAFCIPAFAKSVPTWDVIFCLNSAGNDGQSHKRFCFQNFWPIVENKSNLPPFPQSNKCHKKKRRTGGCTNDNGRFSTVPWG